MLAHADTPPGDILGPVDALKLRSCATLFQAAAPDAPVFAALLDTFYGGRPCDRTRAMLDRSPQDTPTQGGDRAD
jgi:uncharacterized protein (DUF1810 family)